jgi:hypothetical protein
MLIVFLAALSAVTAGGVYLTERVDRPRRRAERMAAQAAE